LCSRGKKLGCIRSYYSDYHQCPKATARDEESLDREIHPLWTKFVRKYTRTILLFSWGRSVSIGPTTDWTTGARSWAEATDFSPSLCLEKAHPASLQWVPKVVSRGKARPERDADHSPHLVSRSRMRSYIASPPSRLHSGSGTALRYIFIC
jgi:hypothetical protein